MNCLKRHFFRSIPWSLFFMALTAAAAFAASGEGGGHESKNWMDFVWRSVNFIVLAWFLWWLLAKKVKDFFSGRRDEIKTALEKAVADKEEAEKKFKEYEAKLSKAHEEIDQIKV